MKKISLFLLLAMLASVAFAQKNKNLEEPALPIDENTKLVTYQDVVNEPGTPQELYDRAMLWVKEFYKNTNEVIKKSDRDAAVIQMRSSVRIYGTQKDGTPHFRNIVYYNFKLECRNNRYRYTITDFNEKATSSAPIEVWFDTKNPHWEPAHYGYLNQIDEKIKAVIASLEEGMQPKEEIKDEW